MLQSMWDLSSLTQGSKLRPLQWKCGVLTTGLPGKFLVTYFIYSTIYKIETIFKWGFIN